MLDLQVWPTSSDSNENVQRSRCRKAGAGSSRDLPRLQHGSDQVPSRLVSNKRICKHVAHAWRQASSASQRKDVSAATVGACRMVLVWH